MSERHTASAGRRAAFAATGALLTASLLGACGGDAAPGAAASSSSSSSVGAGAGAAKDAAPLAASQPKTIKIPSIGVTAPVSQIGLLANGRIEEPPLSRPNLVGWYKEGVTPGEVGPSVMLGHVDANKKAAVFARLKELKAGDQIQVSRQDGSTATFAVERLQNVGKDAFPHQKVFGENLDHSSLRLVTCGGAFDTSTGHYKDNLIVWAKLIQSA